MMTMDKKRHSNRYRYWYTKVYTQEEIRNRFGVGWYQLIDTAFKMVSYFPDTQICNAKRCMGMLHMYAKANDEDISHAIEGILWKIERLSATICEHCGKRGLRRKELKLVHCLCTDCYLIHLNKTDNPLKLFAKGKEGRFNVLDEK